MSADDSARQGTAYFDAGDYERARQAFVRVYELRPTPEALLNLALAEVNSQHIVEGIQHLRTYLRMPTVAPNHAAAVREGVLLKAYAKVARLSVNVPSGTTVRLDDRSEVVRPGQDELLVVVPGSHRLRAADGRTVGFTADAGAVINLSLPPATTPASAPVAATSAPVPNQPAPTATERRTEPAAAYSGPERDRQFWDTRTVVLTVGAGITLAALGAGTYFLVQQSNDQGEVDARRQDLRTKYGTPNSCLEGRVGAQDPWCSELDDLVSTKVRDQNLATASFVAAGVAGAGTLAAFLLWPRGDRRADGGVAFTPIVIRDTVGISVSARY